LSTLNNTLTASSNSYQAFFWPSGSGPNYTVGGRTGRWALAIGPNFGVTTDGAIYSTSGKIGDFLIDTSGFSTTKTSSSDYTIEGDVYTWGNIYETTIIPGKIETKVVRTESVNGGDPYTLS
jgi:hypothetical protein